MSKINSPYVCKFIEKIENTRNIHIVMEYAGKQNLEDYIKEKKDGANIKPQELKVLLGNVCRGLEAIHQTNIIHRDLKVENIVLSNFDTPKIVDFGFAREIGSVMGIAGTLNYMAPELCDKNTLKK